MSDNKLETDPVLAKIFEQDPSLEAAFKKYPALEKVFRKYPTVAEVFKRYPHLKNVVEGLTIFDVDIEMLSDHQAELRESIKNVGKQTKTALAQEIKESILYIRGRYYREIIIR
ncbi:MAG: hypothetical protein PHX30_05735 [Candidatus Pacebacteria bacterium]|jgi:hypothetical protein|nr:hypothetical protein [Candidatus Paceibacterota bacterium]